MPLVKKHGLQVCRQAQELLPTAFLKMKIWNAITRPQRCLPQYLQHDE
jgi:hypothetical protein